MEILDRSNVSAGTEEIVITPPTGSPTLGTIQRSVGVHDDLYARALVLNGGRQEAVILSLDLIGMAFDLADEIRQAISISTGIKNTFIHCTHNHSAPFTIPWSVLGFRWLRGPGKAWRDNLVTNLTKLVTAAKRNIAPVVLRAGRAPVRLGTNRRLLSNQGVVMKPNPTGPIVPWVDVLSVNHLNGKPAAILFSHAAHPVIIHGSSRYISSEFPGFAVRKLKEHIDGDLIAMFGQAFAGNINADPLRGGMDAAERAGEILAYATLEAIANSEPLPNDEFHIKSVHCGLPLQPLPSEEECRRALQDAEQRLRRHYGRTDFEDDELWRMQDQVPSIESQLESTANNDVQPMEGKAWWMVDTILCLQDLLRKITHAEDVTNDLLRFDAHLLRIGDHWSLLMATHELFAEYQLMLDSAAPTRHNMMLAYTNGCESYIPMEHDVALGGYEAASFPDEGAALRYPYRRALGAGFEELASETLRSLWS